MDYKVSCKGGFIHIRAYRFGGIAVCVLTKKEIASVQDGINTGR
jgi:hypothetical protein